MAALFLKRFVRSAKAYTHFDIYGWVPRAQPGKPYRRRGAMCQRRIRLSEARRSHPNKHECRSPSSIRGETSTATTWRPRAEGQGQGAALCSGRAPSGRGAGGAVALLPRFDAPLLTEALVGELAPSTRSRTAGAGCSSRTTAMSAISRWTISRHHRGPDPLARRPGPPSSIRRPI